MSAIVVSDRTIRFQRDAAGAPTSRWPLLNNANGKQCCCGAATCSSCCRAGLPQNQCCYRIGDLIKPTVQFYSCHWYAEDAEFGELRSAEATFIMTGGPYEIANVSDLCSVTIAATGTWRSWLDNNTIRNISGTFTLSLGPLLTEWGMSFPAHPIPNANLWSPRGSGPPGSYGCDYADGNGGYTTTFPNYPNPINVTAEYQVLIGDAAPSECTFTNPTCVCTP